MKLATKFKAERDFQPSPWRHYFDEAIDIEISIQEGNPDDTERKFDSFRVYLSNFCPPYTPARGQSKGSGEGISEDEFKQYDQYPTLVLLHGGGYSGLTWGEFANSLLSECYCRLMAIDLRSHGDTKTIDEGKMDIGTLVDDVVQVILRTHNMYNLNRMPKLVLIGHSMGGAIAIKCAAKRIDTLPSIVGFVIIDVVEGSAKDALPLMMSVIRTRPKTFNSLKSAINWAHTSGMTRNLESAKVSMPGNLVNMSTHLLGIHHIDMENQHVEPNPLPDIKRHIFDVDPQTYSETVNRSRSNERPQDLPLKVDKDGYRKPQITEHPNYCWRTDLAKTESYWPGWFDGLSQMLLDAPVQGKFLLLAGIDRLDRTLTIGQMQGKFMMKVLPKCGHAVHEDSPAKVAVEIKQFLLRNKFTKPVVQST